MKNRSICMIIFSIILGIIFLTACAVPQAPGGTSDEETIAAPIAESLPAAESSEEPETIQEPTSAEKPEETIKEPVQVSEPIGPVCGNANVEEGEECDIGGAKGPEGSYYPTVNDPCRNDKTCRDCKCALESCEGTGIFDNDECSDECSANQLCIQKAAKSRCYKCFDKCPSDYYVEDNQCDDACGLNEHCQKDPINPECFFCLERCPSGQYFGDGTCNDECGSGKECTPAAQQSCYYCATQSNI